MHKRLGMTAFATFALLAAMAAQADTQPGFYVGGSFGTTKVGDDAFDGSGVDDSDTGFKAFGGYTFNDNFAVEVTYFDFGEASGRFNFPPFGNIAFDVGVSGLAAAAVGRLPISPTFAVFGKLGFASYDVDVSVRGSGFGGGSGSQSESDLMYGVGGSLSFAPQWEARVEYEAINVDGGDANMLSIGANYRF